MTGPQWILFCYFVVMTIFDLDDVWSFFTEANLDLLTRPTSSGRALLRAFAHAFAAIAVACWY